MHVYLIEVEYLDLVDARGAGAESVLADYVSPLGRCMTDIAGLFLTTSHSDHISATTIKGLFDCPVYDSSQKVGRDCGS